MALEGLTKITSIGLAGGIDITGITTTHGMQLSGITTGLAVSGVATFTDNVTVAGTLTYEDVTNIDSVGIITARKGISVSGGGTLDQANITGVSTFGGTLKIPTVAGTNNDAFKSVLFQTAAGIIDGGSGLRYHPANDQLSVNGTTITSCSVYSSGGSSLKLADANYSSTTYALISNKVDIGVNDNVAGAFKLKQGSNEYITVDTTNSSEAIKFGTAGTERLRIRDNGNVSIASSLAVTGVTTSSAYDLSAIDKSIADTAVDIFVYDTRKDSDGGAWRKRTSHTSWYNETFSATRGSKKEFPAVAVISVIGGTVSSYGSDNGNMKIKIYDGDDPEMPLWMEFEGHSNSGDNFLRGGTNYPIESVAALNGVLCIARKGGYGGALVSFIDEFMYTYWDATTRSEYGGSIAERNSGKGGISQSGNGLVNATTNDVAMTVVPNAKIMKGTGLPSPTIAFATDVGVAVVREIGVGNDFVDAQPIRINDTNGTYDTVNKVEFTKDHKIVETRHSGTQFGWMYVNNIPSVNQSWAVNNEGTALSW